MICGCQSGRHRLAWAAGRPGITALLLGASRPEQVADNVAALALRLSPEHRRTLDEATAPEPAYPDALFSPAVNRMVFGGRSVAGWGSPGTAG